VFSSKRNGGKHNLNLWRMGADGANPVALTSDPDADNVNLPGSAWNATPGRITFSSDRVANDEIWTMLPDGRSVTRVTPDPAPDWEPS
jgi:Tol biopolymer transport system component